MSLAETASAEIARGGPVGTWRTPAVRLILDVVKYGAVSVAGLTSDYAVLLLLVACGVHYLVASFLGFTAGSIVVYVLCIHCVFTDSRRASREAEIFGFFAVGLAGLALTQLLLWIFVSRFGVPVGWAKVPAVGIVFCFNFWFRRTLVFVRAKGE